jgi:hypothetical protein
MPNDVDPCDSQNVGLFHRSSTAMPNDVDPCDSQNVEGMEGSGVINFSNFIIRVVNFTILCLLGKRGKWVEKEAPFLDNEIFY